MADGTPDGRCGEVAGAAGRKGSALGGETRQLSVRRDVKFYSGILYRSSVVLTACGVSATRPLYLSFPVLLSLVVV